MDFVFYLFGITGLVSAVGVVAFRNPIHSALALVAALFSTAGIYILLDAEFLAVLEVIIYAGAIMVLFLFVLMCLNIRELKALPQFNKKIRPFAIGITAIFLVDMVYLITKSQFGVGELATGKYTSEQVAAIGSNAKALGQVLYTRYLLPFEAISLLLLVAMIGAILLMKEGLGRK